MKFTAVHVLAIAVLVLPSEAVDYVELLRKNSKISEDGRLDFVGLAAKYGHPAEVHSVTTDDGYILTLFHIPGTVGPPMLLSHGDTVDADCFIVRGNISLAITLANKGYDLWIPSYRGTIYSQGHVSIDVYKEPSRFFNYTYHEKGIYDVPVVIDYILQQTNKPQVIAIGYSVGTTVFFVMGSERPEYNDKVIFLMALAPICFQEYQQGTSIVGYIAAAVAVPAFYLAGVAETEGRNQSTTYALQSYCLSGLLSYEVCVRGEVFGRFGPDEAGFEAEFIPTMFGHFPGGSTRKQYAQYGQVYKSNQFRKFDYGPEKNKQLYNCTMPPAYNLTSVTMKVALVVGQADYLSTEKDVQRLAAELPNDVRYVVLPYEKFNHFDFVYGRYMNDNFYPTFFDILNDYV